MESNHPGVGLPPPAGFEDRMGHQTPAAPRASVAVGLGDPSNVAISCFRFARLWYPGCTALIMGAGGAAGTAAP